MIHYNLASTLGTQDMTRSERINRFIRKHGFEIDDELAHLALSPSNIFEHKNNRQLEYLGDAVLELLVRDYWYSDLRQTKKFNLGVALITNSALARTATALRLHEVIWDMLPGEVDGKQMANAVEAFLAAIYLKQGLDSARSFFVTTIIPEFSKDLEQKTQLAHPKCRLQSVVQLYTRHSIEYRTQQQGREGWLAKAVINGEVIGNGFGKSKKAAEAAAATDACENYYGLNE
jgi:ribonuclease-3